MPLFQSSYNFSLGQEVWVVDRQDETLRHGIVTEIINRLNNTSNPVEHITYVIDSIEFLESELFLTYEDAAESVFGPYITNTPTPQVTLTRTPAASQTATPIPSATSSSTPTRTAAVTPSNSGTRTPTPTPTRSLSATSVAITPTPSTTRSAPVTPTPSTTRSAPSVTPAPAGFFGDAIAGIDSFPCSGNRGMLTLSTLSANASLTTFNANFSADTTVGVSYRGLIYADNNGTPGQLVATTSAMVVPSGGGWVSGPIVGNISSGNYWLGVVTNSHQARISDRVVPSAQTVRAEGLTFDNPPASFVVADTYNYSLSVFVDYGGSTITPTPTRTPTVTPSVTRSSVTPTPTPTISLTPSITASLPAPVSLNQDFSYVNTSSPQWSTFMAYVNAALNGPDPYAFAAKDAAVVYRVTGDVRYAQLAIDTVDAHVFAAESAIAAGGAAPVAGDSYLEVGPAISDLAVTYAWCNPSQSQKTRWAAYADQAVSNIWNFSTATWGGRSFPWTGWSVSDPGNNYYYSFCMATMTWALAANRPQWLALLRNTKFPALVNYMSALTGGGSREGTGYGVAHKGMFDVYQIWLDSGQGDLSAQNTHLTDSIKFWIHATMPTRNKYQPIGDLSRESYPNLFDYHRELMLKARHLTHDAIQNSDASWWLNNISVRSMAQSFERRFDLLPAGSNTTVTPSALSYYASGTGNLFSRTSWATDATYMHFIAGVYDQSHAHQEQGGFTFFKNDFLAVSSNIFSNSGIEQDVAQHNVLRFTDSSGNIIRQNNGTATMMPVIGSNGNVFASANLKGVMNDSRINSWNRSIDFTNGVLRVMDAYSVANGINASFQVITPTLPTINGNVITTARLRIEVITPGSPLITIASTGFGSSYRVIIGGGSGSYDVILTAL